MSKPTKTHAHMPPFKSDADAEAAVTAFGDELAALREKHGIHHMVCLFGPVIECGDDDEGAMVRTGYMSHRFGSDLEMLAGVAALGSGRLDKIEAMEALAAIKRALEAK